MLSAHFWRVWLFVSGHEKRKMERAGESQADAVVLDWEDSVLPEQKPMAREGCRDLIPLCNPKKPILVRINSYHSEWYRDDVEELAGIRPDGLVLPKCESAEEIRGLISDLQREANNWEFVLCPMIESPLGLLRVEAIATASDRVCALAFGAQDFSTAAGIRPSSEESELLMAKSQIVTVARAYRLAAVDSPVIALDNPTAIREASQRSYRLGFSGKFAIHPRHIPAIAEAFTPTSVEAKEAEEILQQARSLKAGAFAWKGQMVDEAVLEKARITLQRFQAHLATRS
jgi:citrate lyase subunit beta/citryl-CoA lyase